MSERKYLKIGVVTKPHGLTGELRVALYWAESTLLEEVTEVLVESSGRSRVFSIQSARRNGRTVLLRLDGVADRDAAAELARSELSVERAAIPPLEPGEYYLCDLLGAEVFCGAETRVGRVVALGAHPSVDTIVIEFADGTRREQPLLEPYIQAVDVEQRRIELVSLDGLM